ncbi:CDP-alcohol phosphatidyltransferase family protein [Butyrivibrio sp. DSM 10294]|jgi:phosphatidylglycerophosphate synthase|uniref:CDP-alcohol phosphatidyltransferase family protein n=1 Tax=Butyrivibrio sp. DSM 10294 TaxID=2972457 RepID=UPI00234F0F7E|nr:CDP-alcohol phosphatidyltransferase family protein [Butyrivibrio sp. DSM 10294]MDC7293324.1 CDP-alcohol phosphatidyltransferase family protein [Butyrivibrio sp. DSM 10294]
MSNSADSKKAVKKIVPSKLENASYPIIYRVFGRLIPETMTPNQMTLLGAIGGLFGIVCAFLARVNLMFLIGTVVGLIWHIICDDLDGYIARKRNMASEAGAFFDLLTDILHITYLLIGLAFAKVASFEVMIFMVPVYALMMFTAMNYIRYLNEFLFPRLGPIETHLFFAAVCIITMIVGTDPVVTVPGHGFTVGDIIILIGAVPMYYEMIRLQIQLFIRLSKKR